MLFYRAADVIYSTHIVWAFPSKTYTNRISEFSDNILELNLQKKKKIIIFLAVFVDLRSINKQNTRRLKIVFFVALIAIYNFFWIVNSIWINNNKKKCSFLHSPVSELNLLQFFLQVEVSNMVLLVITASVVNYEIG